ncbi:hypothetical protein Dip510_001796 [Elusimicrobium posterum]|uniref:hypothetical protein n=1 Tax=Elusimicrobium posterum TaxID=3116653 RepID=UPI003C73063B
MNIFKQLSVKILSFIDPYKQSFLFFKYKWWHLLILAFFVAFVFEFRVTDAAYGADTSKGFIHALFDNPFTYLPNFLIHEFAHRIVGAFAYRILPVADSCYANKDCLAAWLTTAAGNGVETLVPVCIYLGLLRIRGGRMLLPLILYWIGTTLYGAAGYAHDVHTQVMNLTSSDFISDFKPGEMHGDWYFILKPLGLLDQNILIANIMYILAAFCLVMAVYSIWYTFAHLEDHAKNNLTKNQIWNTGPQFPKPEKFEETPGGKYTEKYKVLDEHSVILDMEEVADPNQELEKLKKD